MTWMARLAQAAIGVTAIVTVGACSGPGPVEVIAGPPDAVVDAYLRAVQAEDCAAARLLETPELARSGGGLCGALRVTSFRIRPDTNGDPASQTFLTQITTPSGFADGSVEPGEFDWFISVERQPDGGWSVSGGGSGP